MQHKVPRIIPITELRKTSEISALCHETNEPVYITKNGYSDLVIMTVEAYEKDLFVQEVATKLAEAKEREETLQALRQSDIEASDPDTKWLTTEEVSKMVGIN